MSLVCFVAPLSGELVGALTAEPDFLRPLVDADGDPMKLDRARQEDLALDRFLARAQVAEGAWCYGPELALEKKWAGIHFLLTGEYGDPVDEPPTAPLAAVIFGHHLLYDEPGGTPPRWSSPREVEAIWQALAPMTAEVLQARYVTEDLGGVYPHRWSSGAEGFFYLGPEFAHLRQLYREAAESGQAVLIRWIT